MFPLLKIVIVAFEAVGDFIGRRKPKSAAEIELQPIQRRNERARIFFVVFCLIFSGFMLVIMARK